MNIVISILVSRFTRIFSAGLIVFLVGAYVYQVNAQTTEFGLISNNQKSLNEITKQNRQLEITAFGTNSLEKITAGIALLNFEKAQGISYIRVLDNQVVKK